MTRKYPTTILFINNEEIYANIVSKREFNDILHDKDETLGLGLDDDKKYYVVNKLVHGEHDTFWACLIHNDMDEISKFDQFMLNLGEYALNSFDSDESVFWLYRTINRIIFPNPHVTVERIENSKEIMYCFLYNEWRAFFEDVLNTEYNYMNVCDLVRDHINKFFD